MTNSKTSREVTRRNFLSDLAIGTTGVVALSALASDEARAAEVGAASPSAAAEWDLTWIDRLTGKYRTVFDSPEVNDGMAFTNASVFLMGFKEVYNATDADMQAVIVMRHRGVVQAFNDAMWEKYGIGAEYKVANAEKKNPWTNEMATLTGRGATLIACNLAASRRASEFAKRLNLDAAEVKKELYANFIPGVIVQTSGVFATVRAQQAGCSFMKSG